MKNVKVWLMSLCFCACVLFSMEVSAESDYVYDYADLLTVEEEDALQKSAEFCKEQWNMNFLVVTTDDAEGKSSRAYADDFYDQRFPEESEEDGVLYLIDMDNREIYLFTSGEAIRYLTDSRIDRILDDAYECVAAEDYYGTFAAFFLGTDEYLNQGIPKDQYHYDIETGETDDYYDSYEKTARITGFELLIALAAATAAALGTCGFIKGKYQLKFEDFHYDAYTDSEVLLNTKEDRLINSFVTHRKIPRNNGTTRSSEGGGGRSSVHRASSGRSHGGGGRKF